MPRLARMFLVGAVVLLVVVVAALSSQRERRDPSSGSRTVSVAASADGHCRQRLDVRAGNHSEGEVVVCAAALSARSSTRRLAPHHVRFSTMTLTLRVMILVVQTTTTMRPCLAGLIAFCEQIAEPLAPRETHRSRVLRAGPRDRGDPPQG